MTLPVREGAGQAWGGSPCTAAPSWGPRLSPGKHSSRLGSQQEGDGPGTPVPSRPLFFLPRQTIGSVSPWALHGLPSTLHSCPSDAPGLPVSSGLSQPWEGSWPQIQHLLGGSSSAQCWAPGRGEESPRRQQRDRTGTRPGRPSRGGVPASVVPEGHISKRRQEIMVRAGKCQRHQEPGTGRGEPRLDAGREDVGRARAGAFPDR